MAEARVALPISGSATPPLARNALRGTSALSGSLARPWVLALLGFGTIVSAPGPAVALPQGGQVVEGNAQILTVSPNELRIVQSTDKVIINWQSFNIGSGQAVNFVQASALAQALNRVLSGGASVINGTLTATGQVILSNPAGIHFGPSAVVDVASIIATVANIANHDFMAGNLNFSIAGNPTASVINEGTITVAEGGIAALVAPGAANKGVINARLSKVALASGNTFTIDLYGDRLIQFAVGDQVLQAAQGADGVPLAALVINTGTINADGGIVQLTANAARGVVQSVINTSGVIQARAAQMIAGEIVLDGGQAGDVLVAGTGVLDVSGKGAGQRGGQIAMLGEHVGLADSASLDASGAAGGGTINIGGSRQGQGPLPNSQAAFIAPDATVDASALENGDGGTIIVYADGAARIYGSLAARGGVQGGNGGFVETSGKQTFEIASVPDVTAVAGRGGEWLIDPNNIQITSSGTTCVNLVNCTAGPTWDTTNDSAQLGNGLINAALNAGSNVTITTTSSGTNSQAGDITFASGATIAKTAGGDATLTLLAENDITVSQSISANTAAGTGRLNVVLTADSDTSGAGTVNINAAVTTRGGAFTASGANVASIAAGSVSTAGIADRTGGAVTLTAASAGSVTLNSTITASGGTATAAGLAGGAVDIDGGTIAVGAITTSGSAGAAGTNAGGNAGGIDLNANGGTPAITLHGNLTAQGGAGTGTAAGGAGGAVALNDPATLAANVTINASGGAGATAGAGGAMQFASVDADAVGNNRTLTLNAGTGDIAFGSAVGASQAIQTLTISAADDVTLGAVTTRNGGISVTTSGADPSILLLGNLSTDAGTSAGAVTLIAPVTLAADIAIDTDHASGGDAAVTISGAGSTVNSDGTARALTINAGTGAITFGAAVGNTAGLASLSTTSTAANGTTFSGDVTMADVAGNAVSVTGNLRLAGNTTITTDRAANDGDIAITGTVNADASANRRTLDLAAGGGTIDNGSGGAIGAVGGSQALGGLTATGSTVRFAAITTTGAAGQDGGNVALTGTTSLSVGGTITASGGTAAAASAGRDAGSVTLSGGDVSVAAVTASGSIAATSSDADGGTGGAISIDATDASPAITLAGNLTAVGGAGRGTGNGAAGGAINVRDAATLAANVTLNSSNGTNGSPASGGAIQVESVDGDGVARRSLTLTAGTTAALAGTVTAGALGAATALGGVSATGSTITADSINTKGITGGAGSAVTLTAANTGGVTVAGAIDSSGGAATAGGLAGGAVNLAGGTLNVVSITTSGSDAVTGGGGNAGTIVLSANSATTPLIDLNGNLTAAGGAGSGGGGGAGAAVTLTGPVRLNTNESIQTAGGTGNSTGAGGTITFSGATSTVDADSAANNRTLALNSGTGDVTFGAAVGGSRSLQSLTVSNANDVTLAAVTTRDGGIAVTTGGAGPSITLNGDLATDAGTNAGSVNLTGPVTLGAAVTVDTDHATGTDANVAFSSTINGAQTLAVNAGTANASFGGAIGNSAALSSFTVSASDVTLAGGIDTNGGGGVDFTGVTAVTLAGNVTIDTDASSGSTNAGAVDFGSATVNGDAAGRTLTVNASVSGTGTAGNLTFDGALGNTTSLGAVTMTGADLTTASIDTSGAADTAGAAVSLTATGPLTVNGSITTQGGTSTGVGRAGGAVALTGGDIAMNGAINTSGSGAGAAGLAGGNAGAVVFQATDGTPAITLAGGVTAQGGAGNGAAGGTGGAVTFNDPTVLTTNVAVQTNGGAGTTTGTGGAIAFSGAGATVDADSAANNRTLALNAGTGDVTLGGAIGGGQALQSLTISDANDVTLAAVTTRDGGIAVTTGGAGPSITLNGNLTTDAGTNAGSINLAGPVTLGAAVAIDTDHATGTDANVTFASTVNGAQALTINAGGGAVAFNGAVGASTDLSQLSVIANTITAASTINLSGTNTLALTGANGVTLGGNITTNGGAGVDFTGTNAVTLAGNVTIDTDASSGSTDAGAVDFGSATVDGDAAGRTLTVNAGVSGTGSAGNVTGGTFGTSTALGALTVTGATVALGDVGSIGSAGVTGAAGLTGSAGVTLATMNVGGALTARSSAGSITQGTGESLIVAGATNLTTSANGQSIAVANAGNALTGAVTLNTGASGATSDATLANTLATQLGTSNVRGDLTVTAGGAITQTGALTVADAARFTATPSGAAITLATTTNAMAGPIALNTNGAGGDATLVNASTGTQLAASNVGGNLAVTARAGNLTQTGALTVGGTSSFTVTTVANQDIVLGDAGNALTGAITLTAGRSGNTDADATLVNNAAGGTVLAASTVRGDLSLTSLQGGVTFGAGATVIGALTNTASDTTTTGTITAGSMDLGAVTLAGATTLSSNGTIATGAVTGAGNDLALGGTGAATLASVDGVDALAFDKTGGSATVTGAANANAITTQAANYAVALNGGGTVANAATFSNTGGVTLNGTTFSGGLTSTASTTTVQGTISTGNSDMTLGSVAANGATTLSAGTGQVSVGAVSHGTNDVSVTADAVVLGGAWSGTGERVVQPTTPSRTIGLAGGAGAFSLSAAELAFLEGDSPSRVTIGRTNGTGALAATGFSFDDPLTLRSGSMTITGTLSKPSGQLTLTGTGALTGIVNLAAGTGTFLLAGTSAVFTASAVNGIAGPAAAQQASVTPLGGSTGPFTINGALIPGAPPPPVVPPVVDNTISTIVVNQISSQTAGPPAGPIGPSQGQDPNTPAQAAFENQPTSQPFNVGLEFSRFSLLASGAEAGLGDIAPAAGEGSAASESDAVGGGIECGNAVLDAFFAPSCQASN